MKISNQSIMTTLIQRLTVICVLLCTSFFCWGQSLSIVLTKKHDYNYNHNDESEFGHRVPPRPITCTIDFTSSEISFSPDIEDIEYYELWDVSQSLLLYTGIDSSILVNTIRGLNQECILIVITDSMSYTGYINN